VVDVVSALAHRKDTTACWRILKRILKAEEAVALNAYCV